MIKKIIVFAICFILLTAPAFGEGITCKEISKIAEQIMILRQRGFDLATLIEKTKNIKVAQLIAIEAYKRPQYATKDMQNRAIKDFSNLIYLTCYEATTGGTDD